MYHGHVFFIRRAAIHFPFPFCYLSDSLHGLVQVITPGFVVRAAKETSSLLTLCKTHSTNDHQPQKTQVRHHLKVV